METTGSSSRYEQFHSPARVLHTATGCHHAQHTLTADQICHWLHNAKLSQHEFEADRHTPWSCFILENVVWTSSHSFMSYSTVILYMSLPWGQIKWFELNWKSIHIPNISFLNRSDPEYCAIAFSNESRGGTVIADHSPFRAQQLQSAHMCLGRGFLLLRWVQCRNDHTAETSFMPDRASL